MATATPLSWIGELNLASRPAKRRDTTGIDDLRAIPWVFAWTQSRLTIPAWYGIGTALEDWAGDDQQRWKTLRAIHDDWPMVRTMAANASLGLGSSDLRLGRRYAALAAEDDRAPVLGAIEEEFARTVEGILRLSGDEHLLEDEPALRRRMRLREPYLVPLHLLQVSLLRRIGSPGDQRYADAPPALRRAMATATSGIAAGLRTTG